VPNVGTIPSPMLRSTQATTSMPTASSLSLNDSPSQTLRVGGISQENDREIFSHQTLLLTALAAINNGNHHPTFKATEVDKERSQYMNDMNHNNTSIIDAATAILITDTEILATMTRGLHDPNAHRLVAIKEIDQEDESRINSLLESQLDANTTDNLKLLRKIDEVLPHSDHDRAREKGDSAPGDGVFLSFPNPNNNIPMGDSQSSASDHICKPIQMDKGLWYKILELKSGYIQVDEPAK
jgi:hypothetical protein